MRERRMNPVDGRNGLGRVWPWFALAVLLGVSITWHLTGSIYVSLHLPFLVPLLLGWWGWRFGTSMWSVGLVVGMLSIVAVDFLPIPWFSVSVGYLDQGPVALAAFMVGASARDGSVSRAEGSGTRGSGLLTVVVVMLALVGSEKVDLVESTSIGAIEFNIGLAASLVVLAMILGRRLSRIPDWGGDGDVVRHMCRLGLGLMLLASIVLGARWAVGELGTTRVLFGLPPYGVALAICFSLTALDVLDWRIASVTLLAAVVLYAGLSCLDVVLVSEVPIPGAAGNLLSAVLLGALVAVWWRRRGPNPMKGWPTPALLASILLLQLFAWHVYPDGYGRHGDYLALGGVAFIGGLAWRGRGLVAMPLIVMTAMLLSNVLHESFAQGGGMLSALAHVGMFVFPYAFAGVLASGDYRYADLVGIRRRGSVRASASVP